MGCAGSTATTSAAPLTDQGPGTVPVPVHQDGAATDRHATEKAAVQTSLDLERYTKPESIWKALETGSVRLIKMSYLIELADKGGTLSRRQELPDEAFISVDELKDLYGKGNRDGVLPIIAISFCWDTAADPDPSGKQLATVAATLKVERESYAKSNGSFKGFSEMGVFWDWASLSQKDPKLFDKSQTPDAKPTEAARAAFVADLKAGRAFFGGEAYEKSRSAAELQGFRYALHETMDLWYAHQGTTVYKLTELPSGSTRKVGYDGSGWTTYERCSAEQIKKFYLFDAKWKLVLDLGVASSAGQQRRAWPVGPDDFDALVEGKVFTNGSDLDAVKALYRKMSIGQLGSIKMLDFDGMPKMSVAEGRRLGGCLALCGRLEKLDLARAGISDEACEAIFASLGSGALDNLNKLVLSGNQIGDAGLSALAKAATPGPSGKGALDHLKVCWLPTALSACPET